MVSTDFPFFLTSLLLYILCLGQRAFELLGEDQGEKGIKKGGC